MARLKKNSHGYYVKTILYEGKRYYVYAKDVRELDEKAMERRKELEEKKKSHDNPTMNSYYEYFTDIRRNEQKEATLRAQKYQYKNIAEVKMENGIKFGEMRISDITRRDIEYARKTLLKKGKTPQNLNICFAHLNHVFACAVMDETIDKNPCRSLKRLKRESAPISENRHRALSEEETIQFLNTAAEKNSFYYNVFRIMILTGMRIGEVGALYITDIDSNYIHVRRSVTRDEIGNYNVGTDAKTESGKRDIPLTQDLKKIIIEQKELNKSFFGPDWSGTLFQSTDGKLLREYTVNREIKRICKLAGIEYFTCHGFRVTFATRFIEQRPEDYKILSEIMGHKDISITLNLYTRVMAEKKVKAMSELKIKTS